MNITKFFSLFFLVIFFTSDAYSHGPSRQKVSEKIEIDASSSKVWLIVKDFKILNGILIFKKLSPRVMILVQKENYF